jgi:hypothetical protein
MAAWESLLLAFSLEASVGKTTRPVASIDGAADTLLDM